MNRRSPAPLFALLALLAAIVFGGRGDAQRFVTYSTSPGTTAVPTARTLTAGTGLTGGGDLSANRSFAVSYGTSSGTAAQGNDTRITGAVQASTLTTDGDLLTRISGSPGRLAIGSTGYALGVVAGAPAWALPSALVTAASDGAAMLAAIGATPTTRTLAGLSLASDRTAAELRAALYPPTAISLASSSGWTTSASAGGTATVNTGSAQVDLSLPAAAGTSTNAYIYRTPPTVSGAWEFRARLRTHSGGTAVTDVAQLIVYGNSGSTLAAINVRGDNTVVIISDATVPAAVSVASIRGGQGWARVVVDGGQLTGYVGIGSGGAAPTSWTLLGSGVRAGSTPPYDFQLRLFASRGGSVSGDLSVSWGDLSYTDLAP